MIYKKDPNMTWTDMCIYVDHHMYDDDIKVKSKCFEYLWQIWYINAVINKLFKKYSDYEDFAFYAATKLYDRYQKNLDPNYKYEPIKSCKNYIQSTLRDWKTDYQKKTFAQVFEDEYDADGKSTGITESIREQQKYVINDINSDIPKADFKFYLETITTTVKQCLNNGPYTKDKRMMHNIYLSCLLTFLKMTTLSNDDKRKVKPTKKSKIDMDALKEKDFKNNVVLYHLPSSMFNYIATMYNKVKKEITSDLNYLAQDFEVPDNVVKEMLMENLPHENSEVC